MSKEINIIGIFGVYNDANKIHRILKETLQLASTIKYSSDQYKIAKASNILYNASCITISELNALSKEQAKEYQDALEYALHKLNDTCCNVVGRNIKYIKERMNKEEDLNKLSKEELIQRLKEVTNK